MKKGKKISNDLHSFPKKINLTKNQAGKNA